MAIAVPHFYVAVIIAINVAIHVVTLVLEVVAFVHCLLQRVDAFPAIGTMSKGIWLAILGGCVLFTLLGLSAMFGILSGMIAMIPIIFVLVYLLDVRPALRDAVDGHGSW